jgi:hypothetical protein
MINPYIRAARAIPEIREQAIIKLEARMQEQVETVDVVPMEHTRDDPSQP